MSYSVAQRGLGHADYGKPTYGYDALNGEWIPILVLPDGSISTSSTVILDDGISTGGSATTIDDLTKNWEVDMMEGALVRVKIGLITYSRRVSSNTASQLTFDTIGIVVPIGTKYEIKSESQGENRFAWVSGQKVVAIVGTAVNFSSVVIPPDFDVVISPLNTNTGVIYLGNSKANAEAAAVRLPLTVGQSAHLKITNLNLVWIDAQFAGEGAFYFVEA